MLIIAKHRFILVHNPKTAGMALIESLIGKNYPPNPMSHLQTAIIIDRIFQDSWRLMESVCFVRHPVDRYRSLYQFHASLEFGVVSRDSYSHQIARRYNFAEWLNYNLRSNKKANWFGVPQSTWWRGVKSVFRYEEAETGFAAIGKIVGRTLNVPRLNVSYSDSAEIEMPQVLLQAIMELDHETVDAFGYKL